MKKTLLSLLATLLALTFFATAACTDPGKTSTGDTGDTGNTGDTNNTGDAGDTLLTLTADEWADAFKTENFSNFTYEISMSMSSEDLSEEQTSVWKVDGNKLSEEIFDPSGTSDEASDRYYYEKAEEGYSMYEQENGEWTKSPLDQTTSPLEDIMVYVLVAEGAYSSVAFDAEKGRYFADSYLSEKDPLFGELTQLTVRFENKKLSSLSYTAVSEGMTIRYSGTFSDYGTTSVTLPQVPEIPQKMTKQEWLAAFDEENFKNYTGKTITDAPPSPITYTVMRYVTDGDVTLLHYQTDSNRNTYYEVTPDGSFIYEQQDGVWTKEIYDSYVIDNTLRETIAASYDQAVFNAETNEYVFTDFNVTALDNYLFTFNSVTVSFADGKLAEITCYRDFGNGITNTHIYSDYGTTSVTLPQVGA